MSAIYADVLLGGARSLEAAGEIATAHLELSAVGQSAGVARRYAAFVITHSWRLAVDVGDVGLVVSELVTNAIRAADCGRAMVVLALARLDDDGVQVDVWGPGDAAARLAAKAADGDDLGGRGLFLVDALSAAWGQREVPVGVQVWCRFIPSATAGA